MRAPNINLARRPFRNNSVHYVVFGTCFVLLLVATVLNIQEFRLRGQELDLLNAEGEIGRQRYDGLFMEVERMKGEISAVNLLLLDNKSAFVNGLILSRFFSWTTLFDRLESLIPYDVRIRSIRPSITPREIEIQIDGMAKTATDLYGFEENLGGSEYFTSVYPVSENTRESKTEINFDIVMNYLPAGKSGLEPTPPTPTAGLPPPEGDESGEGAGDGEPAGEEEVPPDEFALDAADVVGDGMERSGEVDPGQEVPLTAVGESRGTESAAATGETVTPATAAEEAPRQAVPPSPGAAPPNGTGNVTPRSAKVLQMRMLSNKEFIDLRGGEIFLRARGGLIPDVPDDKPSLTNAEYIKQFGMSEFLSKRGSLSMLRQKRATGSPGDANGEKSP